MIGHRIMKTFIDIRTKELDTNRVNKLTNNTQENITKPSWSVLTEESMVHAIHEVKEFRIWDLGRVRGHNFQQ